MGIVKKGEKRCSDKDQILTLFVLGRFVIRCVIRMLQEMLQFFFHRQLQRVNGCSFLLEGSNQSIHPLGCMLLTREPKRGCERGRRGHQSLHKTDTPDEQSRHKSRQNRRTGRIRFDHNRVMRECDPCGQSGRMSASFFWFKRNVLKGVPRCGRGATRIYARKDTCYT